MVDPEPDDELEVSTLDLIAIADLGVTHATSRDDAADRIRRRLRERGDLPGGATKRPRLRPAIFGRPLALVFVGLALTGTATAAVVAVVTDRSSSSHGPIPSLPGVAADPGSYTVRYTPDLTVGRTGWCTTVTLEHGGQTTTGASGCGPAETAGRTVQAAGGLGSATPDKRSVLYVLVTARVAAVRLGDVRVIPQPDAALPRGVRIAVLTPAGSPDGDPPITIENTDGTTTPLEDVPSDQIADRRTTTAGDAPYAIVGAEVSDSRSVAAPIDGQPDLIVPTFTSVASVTVREGNVTVTRLVDASDPTRNVPALPGARAVHGNPGLVRLDARTFAARAGTSWLVATANTADAAQKALSTIKK